LFYNFNLEKKVRKNHPLRKLKEILNLDFMSGLFFPFFQGHADISKTLAHFLRPFSSHGGSLSSPTSGADRPLSGVVP
jgi:hypothetical protein